MRWTPCASGMREAPHQLKRAEQRSAQVWGAAASAASAMMRLGALLGAEKTDELGKLSKESFPPKPATFD